MPLGYLENLVEVYLAALSLALTLAFLSVHY
jgi:hypothetical protein